MSSYIRPVNQDQLFQIPLIVFFSFLLAALLAWLLGFGKPSVAVAISLDLSCSTFGCGTNDRSFNFPDSIMDREIQSVRTYLQENSKLRVPNKVQVFGFGGTVQPLTTSFNDNSKQVESELSSALKNDSLPKRIDTSKTNINEVINQGAIALSQVSDRCLELLIVTDGQASVDSGIVSQAKEKKISINVIVVGADAPELEKAAAQTNGVYISDTPTNLEKLFTKKLFEHFNSNTSWIAFFLSIAFASFMWMLALPLDRWLFQGVLKMHMSPSGHLAIGNAIFWTVVTPIVVLNIYGLPFLSKCAN